MNINCQQINLAIKLSNESGNDIFEIVCGWSKMKHVFQMSLSLTSELEEKIKLEIPTLKYWGYDGSPHNLANNGFYCEEHNIAISFPIKN